ncbi:MAG: aminotransferase class V-fold PLP-dependent enzyme, partial [Promethearchaeota archaeon]
MPGEPFFPTSYYQNKDLSLRMNPQEFIIEFSELLTSLKQIYGLKKGTPIVLGGGAHFALETIIDNLIEDKDIVLVVGSGQTSETIVSMISASCKAIDRMPYSEDHSIDMDLLKAKLEEKPYKAVIIPHAERDLGIKNDIRTAGKLIREEGRFLIVDATSTIGAEKFSQDSWNVDIAFSNSNWGLAAPPGLAILSVSQRALDALKMRKEGLKSKYRDLSLLSQMMWQIIGVEEKVPINDFPIGLIYILNNSIKAILEEGLIEYQSQHKLMSTAFRHCLTNVLIPVFPLEDDHAVGTLTVGHLPEKLNPTEFHSRLA